jgi:hypothetical protein
VKFVTGMLVAGLVAGVGIVIYIAMTTKKGSGDSIIENVGRTSLGQPIFADLNRIDPISEGSVDSTGRVAMVM